MQGYTPLFGRIVTSSIWGEDSDTRVVWVTMMAIADKNGYVAGTPPGLARLSNVTLEACEKALTTFLSPDKYSRSKEFEGRRIEEVDGGWRLLNFEKHRFEAKKRSAEYYRQWRLQRKEKESNKERNITIKHQTGATQTQCAIPCATVANNEQQQDFPIATIEERQAIKKAAGL